MMRGRADAAPEGLPRSKALEVVEAAERLRVGAEEHITRTLHG